MWCDPGVIDESLSITATSCPNGFLKFWHLNTSLPAGAAKLTVSRGTTFAAVRAPSLDASSAAPAPPPAPTSTPHETGSPLPTPTVPCPHPQPPPPPCP